MRCIFKTTFADVPLLAPIKMLNNYKIFLHTFKYYHMGKTKIAICQLISNHDKLQNFDMCKKFIMESSKYGAKRQKGAFELAESLDGSLITQYKTLARNCKIWISLGGFHQKISNRTKEIASQKILNTHIMINNEGHIVSMYNKVHLFDLNIPGKIKLKESDFTYPGKCFEEPIQTPIGKIGMLICYDIRFPRASSLLCQRGANILTYPSAFTVPTGEAHWHILNRARAIENRCFIISAAQVGKHNEKRFSYGHSLVIDPWGQIILDMGDESSANSPGVQIVEIDVEGDVNRARANLPNPTVNWDVYTNLCQGTDLLPLPKIGEEEPLIFPFGPHNIDPSCVFARNDACYAFVNRAPLIPGHVLVTTFRNEAVSLTLDCSTHEVSQLFTLAKAVGRTLTFYYKCPQGSCNYTVQDGPAAGRTVPQVHVHVIPRRYGDLGVEASASGGLGQDDNVIYRMLAQHDASHADNNESKKLRSVEDMAQEASLYRQLLYDFETGLGPKN